MSLIELICGLRILVKTGMERRALQNTARQMPGTLLRSS
jgi:hypothetical protein